MTTLQKMAIALALLSPYVAQAQSPSDSRKDQVVCNTVANTVLAIVPPPHWRSPWQQPLRALAKASGGIVRIDPDGWRAGSKAEALDRPRQKYRAVPTLTQTISTPITHN